MVREWYMRRGLRLLLRERVSGEVNASSCKTHSSAPGGVAAAKAPLHTFRSLQNIHQRLFDFVV